MVGAYRAPFVFETQQELPFGGFFEPLAGLQHGQGKLFALGQLPLAGGAEGALRKTRYYGFRAILLVQQAIANAATNAFGIDVVNYNRHCNGV